ncbi:MAG: sulfatase-like hydrolase/transferase [Candidatus Latescibacteria bacterium]|jgi:choline-sulfatase|nr:sulfatase-like hydrolase/transferase [Candidatus Latescibacterota bacterium]MBT4139160.1 sulfatase-like hydrolase/transferase [Candidatus Latescibacterota bacterium]MBT5830412.1 sulfatase-like hydrolase/transferase [Candidatus Latescibacterota bacterium]
MISDTQGYNIVILRSDEHNPRISSLEGHPFVQTPNMERLAEMGTVYESHYCPSPLCMPSRSSFIAGRWVHDIQTYNNCGIFSVDTPSYGQVLDKQGVHSVFFGKVDGYCPVEKMGFSEMHGKGFRSPGDINFGRKPITVRPIISKTGKERQDGWGPEEPPKRSRGDNRTVEAAVQWLQTTGKTMDQPWSMEINISNPHFPQYVSEELWDLYEGHDDLPEHGGDVESAQHPYALDLREHFQTDKFREESVRGLRRGYYGCVTFMDRKIGQMLDVLESTGLIENTIFAYTSDHGEMLGKFGMWWKCSLYDDSVRAPLIVAGPGFGRGVISKTAVSQLDLQASIFDAVGANRPDSWVGTPLQTLAIDDTDHVAFSEFHGHGVRGSGYVIRKGKWKYIHNCEAPHQLFDIERDRDELHNQFENEPAVAADMEIELRKICDPEKENVRADAFTERQLKAIDDADLEYLPGGHAAYRADS